MNSTLFTLFFTPDKVDLSDPLLEDMNIVTTDTTQKNLYEEPLPSDSTKTDSLNSVKAEPVAKAKKEKDSVKKSDKKEKKSDKNNTINKTKTSNKKLEQKPVQTTTTKRNVISSGSIRIVDNPKESRVASTHIYLFDGKYSVQVSSWRKKSQAQKEAKRMQSKGYEVFIVKAYLKKLGSTWYRVRIGGFANLEEAKKFERNKK